MADLVQSLFARIQQEGGEPVTVVQQRLYATLRRIAARHLRNERSGHTLQPTALVHEAYLKLYEGRGQAFAGETHFLAVASRVMRQVLVDHARARGSKKRAPSPERAGPVDVSVAVRSGRGVELIDVVALDKAIQALAGENEWLATLIDMKYFGGMTAEEIASTVPVSVHVVRHDLRFAQAWLRRRLAG
jgi:RNA polymerase sigma factor (TIGR02999 family)